MSEKNKYSDESKVADFVQEQEAVKVITPEPVGSKMVDTSDAPMPWDKKEEQIALGNTIGWQQIKMQDLPTQGLFYPADTEVVIRAAVGAEIRHWSTLDETDLSVLDDMLNWILERCAQMKSKSRQASWKDIKEIDRFYILLAIRELTFINGENKLQVKTSESKKIDVTKNMVEYIKFDDRLMKFYDDKLKLFNIHLKDGTSLKATLPSVGVTNFVKKYVIRKTQNQEVIDEDYVSFAPFVILDWRGLNDTTYQDYIEESIKWSIAQVSGLTYFKEIFMDTVNPVVRYRDEEGGERSVPLNFQGGIKSIFLISDPFR